MVARLLTKVARGAIKKSKKSTPANTRALQTKVLMKAKENNMRAKNFRMKNPKDKDVQALYKANPNLKKSDASRQEGRDYQKSLKKAKTPAQKVRVINRQRRKQIARDAREENERNKYKALTESDLKRLINSRAKNLEMSVSEYMRLKFDNPFVEELKKRKNKAKGGITMPMHGKKKSKMMARGGMKKKSKMMARGGMKKSKMMARGGMKKTKSYARGGAARRK